MARSATGLCRSDFISGLAKPLPATAYGLMAFGSVSVVLAPSITVTLLALLDTYVRSVILTGPARVGNDVAILETHSANKESGYRSRNVPNIKRVHA